MTEFCTDTSPHGPHEHYGDPPVLRRECPGRENEGTRLVAALTAAGFTTAGHGRGYVRMGWPGSAELRGSLLVPTDDTDPEYTDLLAAVRQVLGRAVRRGEAARYALDLHAGEVPS
ncbi:hypothetical protein [Micromonospora carbonacea]|uniref:Uncharacterized protein n=1 Tax=Micromonospora carbonacea TaxID=47853 RepID=A0A1C5ACC7_9ACTN|nr:hypothetical protein [Micromonospora carbonacea]SCF42898.1 hypothetical protein GA0070563_112151 [Micromonospora carbonacea]